MRADNYSFVSLQYKEGAGYPGFEENFSPSSGYPEYPFLEADIARYGKNDVYELVRNSLNALNLDVEHFGTPDWNPLGEMLRPGQTVVIKPNMVMDHNDNKAVQANAMECLVTHPSCVRAIVDYCVIALREDGEVKGRIIVADAPMQGCKWDVLVHKMHYDGLILFYKNHGIQVELQDLREYETIVDRNSVLVDRKYTKSKGTVVHLGEKSMHYHSGSNEQYRVTDYDEAETMNHHHGEVHDYEVSSTVLQADLLINFSKPKTHRLAGITAALKNMVGATYNKATLPHRTAGSKEEGGDAYLHKSWLKSKSEEALNRKVHAEEKGQLLKATLLRYVYGGFLVAGRTLGKDKYYIGSWYGNDTIWRTVIDLNYIVNFADRDGNLHDDRQRNILYLGDMIIAGEHNGPVSPEPKSLGVILAALDGGVFDKTVCHIMGFEEEKIPELRGMREGKTFYPPWAPVIFSNVQAWNEKQLDEIQFPKQWKFVPHDAWKDVL